MDRFIVLKVAQNKQILAMQKFNIDQGLKKYNYFGRIN